MHENKNPLELAYNECKPLLWAAFWFGLFINLLMLAVPLYSLQVLDRVLSSGSLDTLLLLSVIVVVALLFMGIMQALRSLIFSHLGRWLDDKLSTDLVNKTVEMALHNSQLGSQPLRDLNSIRSFVTSPHLGNMFDAPWAVIFFIVIYLINVNLGYVVTAGAAILAILAFTAQRMPSDETAAANEEQIKSMQSLETIIRNAEVVKAMGLLGNASRRWREHNQKWLQHSFGAANKGTVISQMTKTIRLGLQTLIMGYGAFLALSNEMSPGAIIAVSILTSRALAPFDAAGPLYHSIIGVTKAMGRLRAVDEAADLVEKQTMALPEPKGVVHLAKVSVEAPGTNRWLLRNLNIKIEAGEAIGVIGPSGAGKTTLARALVGVVRPTVGFVNLDGAALTQWDPKQLGDTIGYLPQGVELFDGTVAENIARLEEGASDEAIIRAAQLANVHQTIVAFPDGYGMNIGPSGSRLSAGQRQRIALARCFFGNPRLLVLDEPNANLDGEGEMAFVKALSNAKQMGITTFTIAHRPSVLQTVDKILVLQNGEAKKFGPTQEIMAELAAGNAKVRSISDKQQEKKA